MNRRLNISHDWKASCANEGESPMALNYYSMTQSLNRQTDRRVTVDAPSTRASKTLLKEVQPEKKRPRVRATAASEGTRVPRL